MTPHDKKYVLVTAACNEEGYIEKTIQSVVAQTIQPQRWVIVSDVSTDRTDEIVLSYAEKYPFIKLVRVTEPHPRNFLAQIKAINLGCDHMDGVDYNFIANLDADVTFAPTYYSKLLDKFEQDEKLGMAGGFIYEEENGEFKSRLLNTERSLAHAVQMFRRDCFEKVGRYHCLPYGGSDWHAQVNVRFHGWEARAFPEFPVYHHRPGGGANSIYRHLFRQGLMDHSIGSWPPIEVLRLARRIPYRPFLTGSIVRFSGFITGYWRHPQRVVTPEFIKFFRQEERETFTDYFGKISQKLFSKPAKPHASLPAERRVD